MTNLIFSSLFTGGGGADIGAKREGFTIGDGCENNPIVARVYKNHFSHDILGDVLNEPWRKWEQKPNFLHISPPCTNFSSAKPGNHSQVTDTKLAMASIEAVKYFLPEVVTVENVKEYRQGLAFEFRFFVHSLEAIGYEVDHGLYDAANFGLPQSRKRLWIRAVRKGRGILWPLMSDSKNYPKKSWFDAVDGLYYTFPSVSLTPSQEDSLRKSVRPVGNGVFLIERSGFKGKRAVRSSVEPCWTILASRGGSKKDGSRYKSICLYNSNTGVARSLNLRGLARLCDFPDDYQIEYETVPFWQSWSILGNSVLPGMMQAVIRSVDFSI